MKPYRVLTDEEWLAVAPLLPELQPRKETRGRPLTNTREVLNGVLWVMHSGSSWSMLPRRFPSYQTCHRRFKAWQRTGVLKTVLNRLFGPAGDEFHTAIVARMRHPQVEGAPAKPKRGEGASASSALGPDKVWDAAALQSAFSPMSSRAPLMACEPVASLHDDASGSPASLSAEAAQAASTYDSPEHEATRASYGSQGQAYAGHRTSDGAPLASYPNAGVAGAGNPFRATQAPPASSASASTVRPWGSSAGAAWANPMKSASESAPAAAPASASAQVAGSEDASASEQSESVSSPAPIHTAQRSMDNLPDNQPDTGSDNEPDDHVPPSAN